ncbi:hypothetical protein [Riemerella columbipharyngis]|nr:hypothetical protein [Riemerella columbipharyngis]
MLIFFGIGMSAQTRKPFEKGSVLLFWGWNRGWFSNSDIGFSGEGYKFQLDNVAAYDRPTKFDLGIYFGPTKVTLPQTNARIAYFIKDNVAIVLGLDHMKYVMDQNQTVNFHGYISDPKYAAYVKDGKVDLSDEQFLTFEHTDGLNYINIGAEKYKTLVNHRNFDLVWGYGAGGGVMFPKSNVKLFGNERSDRFHVAGFGADVRTNLNFVFWKHFVARVEAKYGYVNMWDIKTTLNNNPDKAWQDFAFGELNFGIGYTFRTKKNN